MSRKHKHKNLKQNPNNPDAQAEPKKTLKPVPKWKDDNGNLLKLKRADFPYNRAGIIAYCDYRIEYWKIKKEEMLKKADPRKKLDGKRDKLTKALKEVEALIESEEREHKTNS